jgi:integrase
MRTTYLALQGEVVDCKDFFSSSGRWAERMREKGHYYGNKYFVTRRGYMENYIIPAFGRLDPRNIKRRDIDNWLLGLKQPDGKRLAGATKNKIMYTMSLIFEELMDLEIIEKNPAQGIKPFNKTPVLPRGVIDRESLVKLYPETHEQLLKIWGSSLWVSMMLIFNDTGCRPGELRALVWADLDAEKRFFPIRKGVEAGTADTIKCTKTGVVRIGFLTVRTVRELRIWRKEAPSCRNDDFIFTHNGKKPVSAAAVIKAFRRGLKNAGMENRPWTPIGCVIALGPIIWNT